MLTRDPILAQEPNDQPEQPISGSERVAATKAVVLLVEEDALLRRQLLQAVPQGAVPKLSRASTSWTGPSSARAAQSSWCLAPRRPPPKL